MKSDHEREQDEIPSWERLSSEPRHRYHSFSTREDRVRSPRDGKTHTYDIVESADAVTVVALTTEGELVMVEQFRHGIREPELEFAGGVMDHDEDPVACAARELQEETGYIGEAAELLGTITLNPSWQTTRVHVVRVWAAEPRRSKELDDGEDTRVRILSVEEVLQRAMAGSFRNAVAVAALALHLWGEAR